MFQPPEYYKNFAESAEAMAPPTPPDGEYIFFNKIRDSVSPFSVLLSLLPTQTPTHKTKRVELKDSWPTF